MTASTMRCCRKPAESLVALLLTLFVALTAMPAVAADIDMRNIQLVANDEGGFTLAADFAIDFSPRLEEAVSKGLALHFLAEFELSRPRWYWFDEKVVKVSQTWRLTYHALTRQYRLSTGALHQVEDLQLRASGGRELEANRGLRIERVREDAAAAQHDRRRRLGRRRIRFSLEEREHRRHSPVRASSSACHARVAHFTRDG